jgi:chromosome segregation ATPase
MNTSSRDNLHFRTDSDRNDYQRNSNTSPNLSSRTQSNDGSTTIRRTLVERGLRPASRNGIEHERSSSQSSATIVMSTIARQHEDEQRELQELNAKFSIYLDRVHYLEDYNRKLSSELDSLKQAWGSDATQLQSAYAPQLLALRQAIDGAIRDQSLQELKMKRHEYDAWQIEQQIAALDVDHDAQRLNLLKQQLDSSNLELEHLRTQFDQRLTELARQRAQMENLLNTLDGTKNELDNQQLERILLENELQTLREHAGFQDAIYQSQRAELLSLSKI